jgi:hypothetical protein
MSERGGSKDVLKEEVIYGDTVNKAMEEELCRAFLITDSGDVKQSEHD